MEDPQETSSKQSLSGYENSPEKSNQRNKKNTQPSSRKKPAAKSAEEIAPAKPQKEKLSQDQRSAPWNNCCNCNCSRCSQAEVDSNMPGRSRNNQKRNGDERSLIPSSQDNEGKRRKAPSNGNEIKNMNNKQQQRSQKFVCTCSGPRGSAVFGYPDDLETIEEEHESEMEYDSLAKRDKSAAKYYSSNSPCIEDDPCEEFFDAMRDTMGDAVKRSFEDVFGRYFMACMEKIDSLSTQVDRNECLLRKICEDFNEKISYYGDRNAQQFQYLCMRMEHDRLFYQQQQEYFLKSQFQPNRTVNYDTAQCCCNFDDIEQNQQDSSTSNQQIQEDSNAQEENKKNSKVPKQLARQDLKTSAQQNNSERESRSSALQAREDLRASAQQNNIDRESKSSALQTREDIMTSSQQNSRESRSSALQAREDLRASAQQNNSDRESKSSALQSGEEIIAPTEPNLKETKVSAKQESKASKLKPPQASKASPPKEQDSNAPAKPEETTTAKNRHAKCLGHTDVEIKPKPRTRDSAENIPRQKSDTRSANSSVVKKPSTKKI